MRYLDPESKLRSQKRRHNKNPFVNSKRLDDPSYKMLKNVSNIKSFLVSNSRASLSIHKKDLLKTINMNRVGIGGLFNRIIGDMSEVLMQTKNYQGNTIVSCKAIECFNEIEKRIR
jgi:hypothetical protein